MTDQLNDTRTQTEHQIHMRKRRSIRVFVARFERPKTNLIRILRWWVTDLHCDVFETWLLRVLCWRHRWWWQRGGSPWQAGRRSRTPAPATPITCHHSDVLMWGIFIGFIVGYYDPETLNPGWLTSNMVRENSWPYRSTASKECPLSWWSCPFISWKDDITCEKISMMQSGRYWSPGKRWPCPLPPCLGILCPELSPRPSSLEPGKGEILLKVAVLLNNLQMIV